jgi:N-acetylglucosaminyl-diphospho-decaprenol L-rhamnosyltransferase
VVDTATPVDDRPAPPPRWAAVVVNYESGDLLRGAVHSLAADDSAGTPEIVVVDNGSRDGSVAALRDAEHVLVVEPGSNGGYAAAANFGIARTTAPMVVVCNPDLVVTPGTAAAMLARLDGEPDLAAVGPQILDAHGAVYPSARTQPSVVDAVGHALLGSIRPQNRFTRRYRQLDADPARPRDVDWVSGAMVWLRRSALASVGGWDESFFMYVEDVDLCWRLRRLGWRIAYEPAATVVHMQGVSTDHHPYRSIVDHHRSLYRFASKRWRGARRLLLVPAAVFLSLRAGAMVALRALRSGRD